MAAFNTIEEALEDLRRGKIILVTDDEDRENEGDFICAAQFATTENINFMATHGKGLICMPMSEEYVEKLKLPQMVENNTDNHETAFTVSIDHLTTTTGISAVERSITALACVKKDAKPEDFRRPGHMFPLKAKKNGVLERNGHTEATVTGEKGKKDPLDFVLWKPKKEGEIAWNSPWGEGRPGWHIECSEMSKKYIGDTIDIHAGGEDLIFPHHENEIAQSEACNGEKFANYWMHNGFLNINNKKMSKSAGNFFTVREIGEKYPLQVIRFFMLSAHYRTPLNFSDTLVESAKTGLDRILTAIDLCREMAAKEETGSLSKEETEHFANIEVLVKKFEDAMEDDFNTADAVSAIFEIVRESNSTVKDFSADYAKKILKVLEDLCSVLGIETTKEEEILDEEIEKLIEERQAARKNKDFARADEIRDQLLEQGIVLKDTREGVKWSRA